MEVLLVDTGLALAVLGLLSLLRPVPWLGIPTRRRAAFLVVTGMLLAGVACLLPVRPLRLPGPPLELDRLVPRYQFGEHHEILIDAPPERVYAAVRRVKASEIRLFRLLTWIRSPRFHRDGPETILSPGAERPILDVALGSTFVLLHEEPGREIVVGMIVCCGRRTPARTPEEFWAAKGSVARATMSFHLEPVGSATRLVTQTRVHASDAAAERRFAAYWRVIYPGSAFLRVMWLRAIRRGALAEVGERGSHGTPNVRKDGPLPPRVSGEPDTKGWARIENRAGLVRARWKPLKGAWGFHLGTQRRGRAPGARR